MSSPLTTDERNLPKLLREAERRVNAHVFKRGGDDSLASIPANRDRDVDLLLMEAADEIERLNEQLMKAFGIWPNGANVHSGTCGHEPKEGNEYGSSY